MTNSHNPANSSTSFIDGWNRAISRWMADDPQQPQFPALSQKHRALLAQIVPELLAGHYMILQAPSRFVREEVESNLGDAICEVLSRELGHPVQFSINIVEPTETPSTTPSAEPTSSPEPTREQLAEEHARSYRTNQQVESQPSPTPQNWGHMVSPGLNQHDQNRSAAGHGPTSGSPQEDSRSGSAATAHSDTTTRSMVPDAPSSSAVGSAAPTGTPGTTNANDSTAGTAGSVDSHGSSAVVGNGNGDDQQSPAGIFMNSSYTFENFVTGASNQLAYAACRAVAEYPGNSYNPLLIWGESGLGKTHLLHAIGHYARELRPNMRIKYLSSEELTNDFINSISSGARDDFKRRYRNLDLLIVDDIQFLQGKESTQEEFFHTFNALHQAGKQIVLSSDRPPRQLTTLEDRLRTRFESGLITDVQSPDLETRMAILDKKAKPKHVSLPQEVKELIASRYEKSIRELEGALIRVVAYCSLGHEPISLQAAEAALRDIMPTNGDVEITPSLVIEVVAEFFNLTPEEILGKGRARQIANARQIGMYLCRELTELSLPKLGAAFGGRDHTTVMYAERRIHDKIQEDHKTFNQVQELTQRIKARARD